VHRAAWLRLCHDRRRGRSSHARPPRPHGRRCPRPRPSRVRAARPSRRAGPPYGIAAGTALTPHTASRSSAITRHRRSPRRAPRCTPPHRPGGSPRCPAGRQASPRSAPEATVGSRCSSSSRRSRSCFRCSPFRSSATAGSRPDWPKGQVGPGPRPLGRSRGRP
jgi:hypothetical protein